ncbi:MAG: hypothetical protein U0R78_05370 [Nocardioidaceae bacterium]
MGSYLDEEVLAWGLTSSAGGSPSAAPRRRPPVEAYPSASSVLVVRGDGNVVYGFKNACIAATVLCRDTSTGARHRYRLSAWKHRLDGTLIRAPGYKGAGTSTPTIRSTPSRSWWHKLFANGGTDKPGTSTGSTRSSREL